MNALSKWLEPICSCFEKWKITKKSAAIVLLAAFVVSLVPIFAMSFYCVASADDYNFAVYTHQAWEESHSLLKVIGAAFFSMKDFYMTWQGFFSANFVPSLNPFIFNESLYFITSFITVLTLSAGVIYLTHQVLKSYFKGDFYDTLLVACSALLVFFQFMPDVSQWVFWFDAGQAMIYYGLMCFVLGILFKCSAADKVKGIHIFWVVILSILPSGTSSATTFVLVFMTFKLINDLFLNKKRAPVLLVDFLVFGIAAVGMIVCAVAPGNETRVDLVEGMSFFKAIIYSFAFAIKGIGNYAPLAIAFIIVAITPVSIMLTKQSKLSFRYPLLMAVLSFCIYATRFFTPLVSQSSIGGGRQHNGYFLFEIALIIVNVFYFWGWVNRKIGGDKAQFNKLTGLFKRYSLVYAAAALVVAGLAVVQFDVVNPTSVSCTLSIVSGEAAQYKAEMDERLKLYKDDSIKEVYVEPLTSIPYVFEDECLTSDPKYWTNEAHAIFYAKDFVILLDENSEKQ